MVCGEDFLTVRIYVLGCRRTKKGFGVLPTHRAREAEAPERELGAFSRRTLARPSTETRIPHFVTYTQDIPHFVNSPCFTSYTVCYAAALCSDSQGRFFCVYVCFCAWSACCHRHTRRSRRAMFFLFAEQPLGLTATKSVYSSTEAAIQRQPCSKLSHLCQ